MKRILFILLILSLASASEAGAQGRFEQYKKQATQRFEQYKRKQKEQFDNYRQKANEDFASYLEKTWVKVNSNPPIKRPDIDPPVTPIDVKPIKDEKPRPIKEDKPIKNDKPIKEENIVIDEVIKPVPDSDPRPEPVEPIVVKPQPVDPRHEFVFFGTPMAVRLGTEHSFRLDGVDNQSVSRGWKVLSDPKYDAVIADCLSLRTKHNLSDWHYLKMLRQMSQSFLGNTNEAVLLMAYVYSQSGYKMRLASGEGRLYLCYASKHTIYNQNYYPLDGVKYYPLDGNGKYLSMSDASFPNEKAMSLYIFKEPELTHKSTSSRHLKSARYPSMEFDVAVNKNLIDLYQDYPTSEVGGSFMTRWAMYASAPVSSDIRKNLYPALKEKISGKSELEAAQMILNWVQTAFEYEYDDKVWGGDRAFFADETLFYPYCDCEDRSILFSRVVRDLLGLDVILIYYPGHLATAVGFSAENVPGDYLSLDGKRFVVCDPTFINAGVGMTMPGMNNSSAKVILLTK